MQHDSRLASRGSTLLKTDCPTGGALRVITKDERKTSEPKVAPQRPCPGSLATPDPPHNADARLLPRLASRLNGHYCCASPSLCRVTTDLMILAKQCVTHKALLRLSLVQLSLVEHLLHIKRCHFNSFNLNKTLCNSITSKQRDDLTSLGGRMGSEF